MVQRPPYVVRVETEASPDGETLGLKGAGLVAMHALGLPVPPGFVLTTAFARALRATDGDTHAESALWEALWDEVAPVLTATLAQAAQLGGRSPRTRVAVRSAPVVSMPGIMDSVLDVDAASGPSSLRAAVDSVLRSADSGRARDYRRLYGLPEFLDVAVVVQAMVYGDRGPESAAGVLFTRDPSTGQAHPFGEFLPQARGEDVVSGRVVPRPLAEMAKQLPHAFAALADCGKQLERHFGDVQDIEFTVEEGKLWLLQTRTARRSARAMVRVAVELAREGVIDARTALSRIEARRLGELLRPTVQVHAERTLLVRGLPASPGATSGPIVFSSADVEALARGGIAAILVRGDTSPEDIAGIKLGAGLLTARGGMTSHAAVVARGLGRCAVVGASGLNIDATRQILSTREHTVRRGEILTLDGNRGEVWLGEVPLEVSHLLADPHLGALLAMTAARTLRVYALADGEADLRLAKALPADGILERHSDQPSDRLTLSSSDSSPLAGIDWKPGADSVASGDFFLLSADLEADLDATANALRAAHPTCRIGLATTRLRSDESEAVSRAAAAGLDFIACPPLRTAIAMVASAQSQAQFQPKSG